MATRIRNLSGGAFTLPAPYTGVVPAGSFAVTGDASTAATIANLGGIFALQRAHIRVDAAQPNDVVSVQYINSETLAVPRLVVVQQAVNVGQFTDGGGTSGTLQLGSAMQIPAGARLLHCLVSALTGFAGDVSATMTVGDGTTAARYNTGTPSVFASAAAGVDMGVPSGTAWHTAAKTPVLTVTTSSSFALCKANGAGACTVTISYLQPQ